MIIDPSVIRQVSREKDIDPEKMFGALEEAMSSAARKYYHDRAMVTLIDRQTGAITVYSPRTVVIELDTVGEWAQRRNIAYTTYRDLGEKPEVINLVQGIVDEVNSHHPPVAVHPLFEERLDLGLLRRDHGRKRDQRLILMAHIMRRLRLGRLQPPDGLGDDRRDHV